MKNLKKILNNRETLVFLDFEATQIHHHLIQIGAVKTTIGEDYRITKISKPFSLYVIPKEPVGKYVTKLTGITDEIIKKEGVPFKEAQKLFKKYVGYEFGQALFVTFSSSDRDILNATTLANDDCNHPWTHHLLKNHWDFASYLGQYITDDYGQYLSLKHYLELFKFEEVGKSHDAKNDALDLLHLYDHFLKDVELVKEEYLKTIIRNRKMPFPVKNLLLKLSQGEAVTLSDLKDEIEKDING